MYCNTPQMPDASITNSKRRLCRSTNSKLCCRFFFRCTSIPAVLIRDMVYHLLSTKTEVTEEGKYCLSSLYLRVVNLERGRRQCVDCASQKEDVDSSLLLCLPQMYFRFELAIVSQDDIIVLGCHLLPKSCTMLCSHPKLMDFLPSILYGIQANGVQDVGSKHRNTPSQKGVFFEQLNQM